MAEKQYHKGWLYERDGVKFAPYTLKENLIERDGSSWSEGVDNELDSLTAAVEDINAEGLPGLDNKITEVANRTTTLEERTQYMDATESDVFYITDANGNIALKVDSSGATSFNFITSETDLNSLAGRTESLEGAVADIHSTSLASIQNQITALQERTKYMDASSADDTFYITDGNGNIAAKINASGITSFDFISQGVTSLNALYEELQSHGALIESINGAIADIKNTDIPVLQGDIEALQARTKYVDASTESDTFFITDGNGNIAMKVNQDGVTSFNFTSQGVGDLNSLYGDVDTLTGRVDSLEIAVPEIKEQTDATISALTDRVQTVETRTKYMDASDEGGAFYITDEEGNIGMKVDDNGVTTSVEFIIDDADGEMRVKETLNSLIAKDETHDQAIESLGTRITNEITTTKNELNETITTTKEELSATIDSNVKAINDTIVGIKAELDDKDTALGENIASLAERAAALESRTRFMDASEESGTFAITDGNGNIGMLVDNSGVTITNEDDFIIKNVTSLKTVNTNLNTEITERKADIAELEAKDQSLDAAVAALDTKITTEVNAAKTELNTTITNTKNELVQNIETVETDLTKKIEELEDELTNKDDSLSSAIENLESNLTEQINSTKTELEETIQTTKEELNTTIESNYTALNETIINVKSELDNKDVALGENIAKLAERAAALETRTKYLDASTNDYFAITDTDGNIGLKVDGEGVITTEDFIIKDLTSLREVYANLNKEIQDRKDSDAEIDRKNDAQDQALTDLETNLTKEIEDTKTSLEETIKTTKETLEKDIDDTAAAINQTIETLEEKVDDADEKHTEGIATNVEQINLLKGRMDTAESDIDKLQTESATKEELEADVATINASITSINEAIGTINNTNATQDAALGDLATRAANLETRTKYMNASDGSGFYITDDSGNIGIAFEYEFDEKLNVYRGIAKAMKYYMITSTSATKIPLIGYEKKDTIEI